MTPILENIQLSSHPPRMCVSTAVSTDSFEMYILLSQIEKYFQNLNRMRNSTTGWSSLSFFSAVDRLFMSIHISIRGGGDRREQTSATPSSGSLSRVHPFQRRPSAGFHTNAIPAPHRRYPPLSAKPSKQIPGLLLLSP